MTKFCTSCSQDLPVSSFNKKGEGYQSKCRDCQRAWYKNYYDTNHVERDRLRVRNKEQRIILRNMIRALKDVPCTDCDRRFAYYIMDFDHLYDKKFHISTAVNSNMSVKKILEEVDKCEVVCSNCHRERTHGTIDPESDF